MSDDESGKGEEEESKSHRKRYFSDGSEILHQRTVRRRIADLESALDEEFQDLMQSTSNEAVHSPTCQQPDQKVLNPSDSIFPSTGKLEEVIEKELLFGTSQQVQTTFQLWQDIPDSMFDASYSSDEEILTSNAVKATSEVSAEKTLNDLSTTSSQIPLTDINAEYFSTQNLKEYILDSGDAIMFKESGLKVWEVILVILGISTRFHLSYRARRALIEATKLFAGPSFAGWDISDYHMSKIFDPPENVIMYHFFCEVFCRELETPTTKKKFKNHTTVCEKCQKNFQLTMLSPNRFVSVDIKYQIASLQKMVDVKEGLFRNLSAINPELRTEAHISDVYDGILYKNAVSGVEDHCIVLTINFATDGAPLNESSKMSFWPKLCFINELPPKLRFKYPLLAGLWMGKKEPTGDFMNIFMKSFVHQITELSKTGFTLNVDGKNVRFVVKALICTVDSVARAVMQNRVQYNGRYGCSWCYSEGIYKNGCIRFLMQEDDVPTRTHESHLKDMQHIIKQALEYQKQNMDLSENQREEEDTEEELQEEDVEVEEDEDDNSEIENSDTEEKDQFCRKIKERKGRKKRKVKKVKSVKGVKGYSVLTDLQEFDMVWGFSRDYLHGDLIGVVLHLWSLWNKAGSPVRLTKKQQTEVNERLMKMTPPQEIHRLVRPLTTEKCKWKASEWRSWLLFYAIPCLRGILNDYALQHFSLYVNSIYTLLKTNITEDELQQTEYDLMQFVFIFEILYGEKSMKFNVHTLQYLVQCVRYCGPLWAASTFPSENTIFHLKQCVHGSKGVYEQMIKNTLQTNFFQSLVAEVVECPTVKVFCDSLFARHKVVSLFRSDDVILIGRGTEDRSYVDQVSTSNIGEEVTTFNRCISSGMVIHSEKYRKPKKSKDTVFCLENQCFVNVLNLINCGGTAYAEVEYLNVQNVVCECIRDCNNGYPEINDVVVKHLFEVMNTERNDFIEVTDLKQKCVLINTGDRTYISTMPNTFEIQ